MEWTNCQKLPKNDTQNIPNTYKDNPKLFATEIFEISSKIFSKNIISHRKLSSCRGCSYFCPISYSIIPNILSFYPKVREIQLILFYLKLPFRAPPNFRLINPKFRHLGDLYLQWRSCLLNEWTLPLTFKKFFFTSGVHSQSVWLGEGK